MAGAAAAPLDHLSGLLAWTTYCRSCTWPPVGVSPFLFSPPDGLAAVTNLDMPPDIARPSLLQSEITEGLLHQELTPFSQSLHPLTRLRRVKGRRLCESGVSSWCESPSAISDWSRDGRAMSGGMSKLVTAARPSGGKKRKGETPTGGRVQALQ